jgi:toxin-antitoxin system PIN domain toxin
MTSNATSALFDVNVWLALASEHHTHHRAATAALSRLPNPVFCRVTQASLLRLLTNSSTMGPNVCTSEQAWSIFHRISEHSGAIFQPEPAGLEHQWRIFTSLAQSQSGAAWNDAYLAAFAFCARVQLVTFDAGFKRYRGLDCRLL